MKTYILFLMLFFSMSFLFAQERKNAADMSKEEIMKLSYDDLLNLPLEDLMILAGKFGVGSVEEFLKLMNVEVTTASRNTQSLAESPSSMMVITKEMIKQRGYQDLEEILHDLAGFDFNKDYGVEYSTIFMRGFRSSNSDRFILMYDGIVQNHIWKQNNVITRQFPISQIKQIEVLYGAASALYGTNAFSGIINVITCKADEMGNGKIMVTSGTYGRKNVEFSTAKMFENNIGFNLTFKYFGANQLHKWNYGQLNYDKDFSKQYRDSLKKPMAMVDGKLKEVSLENSLPYNDWGFHGNIYLGKNLTFSFLYWYKGEREGYWYTPFKRSGLYTEWYESNLSYRLNHNFQINDDMKLTSDAVYRSHKLLDSKEISQKYYSSYDANNLYNTSEIVNNNTETFQIRYNGKPSNGYGEVSIFNLSVWDMSLEEQFTYSITSKINFISGVKMTYINTQEDYNSGTTKATMTYSPRHIKNKLAGYSQFILKPISKLSLTLGARAEQSRDELANGYDIVVPRFSAVYKATNNLIFRLQYAEAFQEPDDWRLFSTDKGIRDVPSPNLNPEKLKSYELGTIINIKDKVILSASTYYTIVNGYIVQENDVDANGKTLSTYHFINSSDEITIYGYELNMNMYILENLNFNANVSGAYNYGTAKKYDDNYNVVKDANGNVVYENNVLIGDIAPIKFNFGLNFRYKKLSLYPKINCVSEIKTINYRGIDPSKNPIVQKINGYGIVGLNIMYQNVVKGLDYTLKFDNLFNTTYYNAGVRDADGVKYNARVLQQGFNFMTGFTYNF